MIKKDFEIDRDSRLYPEILRQIPNPPKKLFCRGNPELLDCRKVAVVGSRRYSLYGKQTALMIGKYFGKTELAVVSGLASGIDTFAHTGVLEAGGSTIAVLGTGLDRNYPVKNKPLQEEIAEKGLIVSEYSFPARNRIISGLSEGVVVVEAGSSSGSLITAQFAGEQGRTVYAVPGNINSQFSIGTNLLIRDGAVPLVVVKDVLLDMGLELPEESEKKIALGGDEMAILEIVKRNNGIHVNEIAHIMNKNIGKISAIITVLEIKGIVISHGGKIHLAN